MGMKKQWSVRENEDHQEFGLTTEHATPSQIIAEDKAGLFSICFVRHPVAWYRSFWCWRLKKNRLYLSFPLDHCWDDNYNIFIEKALDKFPDGFMSQLYRYYELDKMDFVGRQENLVEDLVTALKMAGDTFDETVLRNRRIANVSAGNPRYGDRAIIGGALKERIMQAEHWAMETYYKGVRI